MRLALRDLFWLALLVAGATFWWGEHRNALKEGREWRRHSWFFRAGPRDHSHSDRERMAAVEGFTRFTNQELDDHYSALMASDRQRYAFDREPCLLEMAHRGMSEELQRQYDEWLARRPVMQQYPSFFPNNLELLTALRRAQQQPDPLRIDVAVLEESDTSGSKAPLVRVMHTNVDSGKQSFHHRLGGDYLEKNGHWQVILTDERARPVAASDYSPMYGGGLSSLPISAPGGTAILAHKLDLRCYVDPPASGRYQLQVFYHNETGIAGLQNLQGLIVSKSDPIWVTVQNLEQDSAARRWMMPHPALAIVAAGGLLAIFSLARTSDSRWRLSRRDAIWIVLIGSVALGCWLDDQYQSWQIRRLVPDASARWTISAANSTTRY